MSRLNKALYGAPAIAGIIGLLFFQSADAAFPQEFDLGPPTTKAPASQGQLQTSRAAVSEDLDLGRADDGLIAKFGGGGGGRSGGRSHSHRSGGRGSGGGGGGSSFSIPVIPFGPPMVPSFPPGLGWIDKPISLDHIPTMPHDDFDDDRPKKRRTQTRQPTTPLPPIDDPTPRQSAAQLLEAAQPLQGIATLPRSGGILYSRTPPTDQQSAADLLDSGPGMKPQDPTVRGELDLVGRVLGNDWATRIADHTVQHVMGDSGGLKSDKAIVDAAIEDVDHKLKETQRLLKAAQAKQKELWDKEMRLTKQMHDLCGTGIECKPKDPELYHRLGQEIVSIQKDVRAADTVVTALQSVQDKHSLDKQTLEGVRDRIAKNLGLPKASATSVPSSQSVSTKPETQSTTPPSSPPKKTSVPGSGDSPDTAEGGDDPFLKRIKQVGWQKAMDEVMSRPQDPLSETIDLDKEITQKKIDALADQLGDYMEATKRIQDKEVLDVVQTAVARHKDAIELLNWAQQFGGHPAVSQWFGDFGVKDISDADYDDIKKIFGWSDTSTKITGRGIKDGSLPYAAHVDRWDPHSPIYLDPDFWNQSPYEKIKIMTHESAHVGSATIAGGYVGDDYGYVGPMGTPRGRVLGGLLPDPWVGPFRPTDQFINAKAQWKQKGTGDSYAEFASDAAKALHGADAAGYALGIATGLPPGIINQAGGQQLAHSAVADTLQAVKASNKGSTKSRPTVHHTRTILGTIRY